MSYLGLEKIRLISLFKQFGPSWRKLQVMSCAWTPQLIVGSPTPRFPISIHLQCYNYLSFSLCWVLESRHASAPCWAEVTKLCWKPIAVCQPSDDIEPLPWRKLQSLKKQEQYPPRKRDLPSKKLHKQDFFFSNQRHEKCWNCNSNRLKHFRITTVWSREALKKGWWLGFQKPKT